MLGSTHLLTGHVPCRAWIFAKQARPSTHNAPARRAWAVLGPARPNAHVYIGLWYDRESILILNAYTDSDFASCKIDRKSTSGACQFLGCNLISWSSKKQNSTTLSTVKAEYVTVESCCTQVLWIKR